MNVSVPAGVRAFVAGFLMAAPLGPVAFIVLRQVLQNHLRLALFAGAGAAFADALLGFSALFGMRWSELILQSYQKEFRIGGGIFLMVLGGVLFNRPPQPASKALSNNVVWIFLVSFLIILCNPLTLTAFVAIFSVLKLEAPASALLTISFLAFCVFCGALLWWTGLSLFAFWGRRHFGISDVVRINRGISIILILVGLYALVTSGIFSTLLLQE